MALRYWRFTCNPMSPTYEAGYVELRLQYQLGPNTQRTVWHRFTDAEFYSCPDEQLGIFGLQFDTVRDAIPGGALLFQEYLPNPPDVPVPPSPTAIASLLQEAPAGPDNA